MPRTYTLELRIDGDHDREPVLDVLRDAAKHVLSVHPNAKVALFTDDEYFEQHLTVEAKLRAIHKEVDELITGKGELQFSCDALQLAREGLKDALKVVLLGRNEIVDGAATIPPYFIEEVYLAALRNRGE